MTQAERAVLFRDQHAGDRPFLIPNPWDVGTARLLARLGYQALATTSAGFAFSRGQKDGSIALDEMLDHAADIVGATNLPVSADLGGGYGRSLKAVSDTYRLATSTGIVGASIEDTTGRTDSPILDPKAASDRVRAAAEAVHNLPFPFMLTARAENYLHGRNDLSDTIRRLQAYQEAGADVLYAPGLSALDEIATVVKSVDRPVNVIAGLRGTHFTVEELVRAGVKRISVGSALTRVAMGAFLRASRDIMTRGTFDFEGDAISSRELNGMFE